MQHKVFVDTRQDDVAQGKDFSEMFTRVAISGSAGISIWYLVRQEGL